jgi:hypothetical protein
MWRLVSCDIVPVACYISTYPLQQVYKDNAGPCGQEMQQAQGIKGLLASQLLHAADIRPSTMARAAQA